MRLRALGLHARRAAALVRICRSIELERLHDVPTDVVAARLAREPLSTGLSPGDKLLWVMLRWPLAGATFLFEGLPEALSRDFMGVAISHKIVAIWHIARVPDWYRGRCCPIPTVLLRGTVQRRAHEEQCTAAGVA